MGGSVLLVNNMKELVKVIFKDDNGIVLAEIVISEDIKTKKYEIKDIVSDKIHKVPYIIFDTLIEYIKMIKEFTNLNIEIIER